MDESELRPAEQEPCIVMTRPGDKWRVSVVPPSRPDVPQQPYHSDFAEAGDALAHAADLAHKTGLGITDMTGRYSQDELKAAIRSVADATAPAEQWRNPAA